MLSMFDKEIPSKYRYQLNGKTAQENYIDFKKEQQKKSLSEKEIETELQNIIEKSLSDILETLKMPL